MAPFGPEWFQPLSDDFSLLGLMRLAWIQENQAIDAQEEYDKNKLLIETLAIYTQPATYREVKDLEEGKVPQSQQDMDFKVVYDTTAFTKRLTKAQMGEVEIHEQREDIAAKVKSTRQKLEDMGFKDPRIHTPPTDADYGIDEGPIIERPEQPQHQIERPKQIERPSADGLSRLEEKDD